MAVGHTATGVWLTGVCAAGHVVVMVGYIIGGSRSYCEALGTCSLQVCRYMGVWQQVM